MDRMIRDRGQLMEMFTKTVTANRAFDLVMVG